MQRIAHIIAGLLIGGMLAACALLPGGGRPAISTPLPPAQGTAEVWSPTATSEPSTTPAAIPTPIPPLQVWPLPADLFYLNEAGQVWRQPLGGDEGAAVPVTPPDLVVRDFALASGGWLILRTEDAVQLISPEGQQGQVIAAGVGLPPETAGNSVAMTPDASRVAYLTAEGFQVLVPNVGLEPLIYTVAEGPLSGLSWSPDGAWLLVQRADGSAALYSAEPLAKWVELGHLNGHTWLRDGRLAFAPAEGGLALLQPGDVNSRLFLVPQDRLVTFPTQRADGLLAFFGHSGSISEPGFLYIADPNGSGFRVESSTAVRAAGLVWDPSGTRVVAADPNVPQTAVLLDPSSGAQATIHTRGSPRRFVWGDAPLPAVAGLPLPADLYFLAPQAGVTQVWRLPADGSPPQPLTAALADVVAYDISPDGQQVVYASGGAIWLAAASGAAATQIVALSDPGSAGMPTFSPDGKLVAYADGGIWLYDLASGEARRLIADRLPRTEGDRRIQTYGQPRWSPDGAWLLVRVAFYEGYDFALLPVAAENAAPLLLNVPGATAFWADALYLSYTGGPYGQPYLKRVLPGDLPTETPLTNLAALDLRLREDGRLALLHAAGIAWGIPFVAHLYSLLPDGGDLRPERGAFVLEQTLLSPDAAFIAGVGVGTSAGQLVLVDAQSGQAFRVEGVAGVHSLRWQP